MFLQFYFSFLKNDAWPLVQYGCCTLGLKLLYFYIKTKIKVGLKLEFKKFMREVEPDK